MGPSAYQFPCHAQLMSFLYSIELDSRQSLPTNRGFSRSCGLAGVLHIWRDYNLFTGVHLIDLFTLGLGLILRGSTHQGGQPRRGP